jgi:hypothetical protein
VHLCERHRKAKAFIKNADLIKAAIEAGKLAIAACVVCVAIIGSPVPPASAQAPAPALSGISAMWEFTPVDQLYIEQLAGQPGGSPARPTLQPTDRGDSDPPHFEGPEQTRDGSASTYSGTAGTFGAINGLQQLSTLPYSGGAISTFGAVSSLPQFSAVPYGGGAVPTYRPPEHASLRQLPPPVVRTPAQSRGDDS